MNPNHIVLAYSGGLDTSAALRFLKERFGCKVTAYCANLGQREDWKKLEQRAKAAGADVFYVDDVRGHFIENFVFPALKANAVYESHYLMGTPLARPVIVEGMIAYARREGGDALAHGCTPKGNDQVRFELSAILLDKSLPTIAPWRLWDLASREDLLQYCAKHDIPIQHSKEDLFSHDENLVHLTTEGEYLEEIENAFQWQHASWITPPTKAPDHVERVTIDFREGVPIAINGESLSPVDIVVKLNALGARNGVGLQDIIENRINGMKVRGVFENPALVVLHKAHRGLECATLSGEVARVRDLVVNEYSQIVYKGLWFAPERKAIQAMVDYSQRHVSGEVSIDLYKGSCTVAAVRSEHSLYSRDLVTLHRGVEFSGDDATGFLRTMALRYQIEGDRELRMARGRR
ncbi:argininosuccinate synthase [Pendulispora rubella]|uniref:Argininosuccinate synthase n=1 Tax=Pendulispora rubella TaxID=2741070 RepID=A0ABZ2LIE9_9BACT